MTSPEDAQRVREGLNRAVFANHLAELLRVQEINCVIDVGAHTGEFGKLLRGVGYAGLIASFEPVSSSFDALEAVMAAQPPWVGHRVALGAAAGEEEITVSEDTSFSSLGEPSEWGRRTFPGIRPGSTETVAVERLDALYAGLLEEVPDPRVLLKIDAQGSEWDVLEGAADSLRRVRVVQVEAAVIPVYEGVRPYTEVIEHLGEAGLKLSGLFPVSRDRDLRIVELDCVLVRPGSAG